MGGKEEVLQLRKNNPAMSMSEISRVVGISRQRVFQLLKMEGLPTRIKKLVFYCVKCDKVVDKEKTFRYNKQKCTECRIKENIVYLFCYFCNNLMVRRKYTIRNRHHFCDKVCYGLWLTIGKYNETESVAR